VNLNNKGKLCQAIHNRTELKIFRMFCRKLACRIELKIWDLREKQHLTVYSIGLLNSTRSTSSPNDFKLCQIILFFDTCAKTRARRTLLCSDVKTANASLEWPAQRKNELVWSHFI